MTDLQDRLYINDGTGNFTDIIKTVAPSLEYSGMITDILTTDFNQDGQIDLVVCGEWMPVLFFENNNGLFQNKTAQYGDTTKLGWWFSLAENDIDQDGDPVLEMTVNIDLGVSEANLEDTFAWWKRTLRSFKSEVLELE